jgi:ABC-type multidrug transport system fused ATPase/permease subunit
MASGGINMRQNSKKKHVLIRMLIENKSSHVLLILSIFAITLYAVNRLAITYFLGELIDTAIAGGLTNALKGFRALLLGIASFILIQWFETYLYGMYSQKTLYYLRERIIKAIAGIPLPSMARYTTGDLISRVNNDLSLIEDAFKETFRYSTHTVITGIIAASLAFSINWKMAIFAVIIPLVISIISIVILNPIQAKQKELQDINGKITELSQDVVGGYVEVKAFRLYDTFLSRLRSLTEKAIIKAYEIAKIQVCMITIIDTMSIALQIGIVFVGLYFVLKGEITMGQLVIFQQIQETMRYMFRMQFSEYYKASAGLERIYELLEEEQEVMEGEIVSGNEAAPTISFRNVAFSYSPENAADNRKQVLSNISFDINKNEAIALVGSSGCGKSTILKLICGFLSPDSGDIYYMGFNYKEWNKRILRQGIAMVDQNTYLFPASIYENIACGVDGESDVNAVRHCVEQSAKQAGIHDFITSLDEGYETDVGEWGSRLSGGQRQRISIARAFTKDANLLILDEPTSALDAESELGVQESIEKLMEGRTTIIVAHRLSTIRNVNRILVIDNGQIVEEGNHDSLLLKRGIYYKLYQKQLKADKEVSYGKDEYASNY